MDGNRKNQPVSREEFEELQREVEDQKRATETPGLDEIADDVSNAASGLWDNCGVYGGCLLVVMIFLLLLEGCWWPAALAVIVVIILKALDK